MVLDVLQPIWNVITPTAKLLQKRIEIKDYDAPADALSHSIERTTKLFDYLRCF
jgi:hypothetical protein